MSKIHRFRRNEGRQYRATATATTRALPATPQIARMSRPFTLAHHPESWSFDVDRGFLPNINQVRPVPGVSGTPLNGDPTNLHAKLTADGFTLIGNDERRLGRWCHYNHGWPVAGGGTAYEFVGSDPIARGNHVRWTAAEDWDDFRHHLVESGMVAPPMDHVMSDMIEIQDRNVGRVRELAQVGKRSREELAKAELMLSKMRETLAAYQSDDEPEDFEEAPEQKPAPKVKVKR